MEVNNTVVKPQVDTGATVSVINKNMLIYFNVKLNVTKNKYVIVANNDRVPILGTAVLKLEYNNNVINHEFVVLEKTSYPIIIGLAVMRQLELTIQFKQKRIPLLTAMTINSNEFDVMLKLLLDQYKTLFNEKLSMARIKPVKLKLKEGAIPYAGHSYKYSMFEMEWLKRKIEEMVKAKLISRSDGSPWRSPVVLVPKPATSSDIYRLTINLKGLNAQLEDNYYPVPLISPLIAWLKSKKFYTELDFRNGFWQIPITKESKPLTCFVIPGLGCFECNCLPMGTSISIQAFQNEMDKLFGHLNENVRIYVDNIIIATDSLPEMYEVLKKVFEIIKRNNLTLNKGKCVFAKTSIKILGQYVTPEGIQPDPDKKKAIINMNIPKNKKELLSFLSLV